MIDLNNEISKFESTHRVMSVVTRQLNLTKMVASSFTRKVEFVIVEDNNIFDAIEIAIDNRLPND